jgi:hypothetical protein
MHGGTPRSWRDGEANHDAPDHTFPAGAISTARGEDIMPNGPVSAGVSACRLRSFCIGFCHGERGLSADRGPGLPGRRGHYGGRLARWPSAGSRGAPPGGVIPRRTGDRTGDSDQGAVAESARDAECAANYVSNEYHEPMPYAVFFAPGGVAFHGGSLTTASHGCVHPDMNSARYYHDHLPVGAEVVVF